MPQSVLLNAGNSIMHRIPKDNKWICPRYFQEAVIIIHIFPKIGRMDIDSSHKIDYYYCIIVYWVYLLLWKVNKVFNKGFILCINLSENYFLKLIHSSTFTVLFPKISKNQQEIRFLSYTHLLKKYYFNNRGHAVFKDQNSFLNPIICITNSIRQIHSDF